MSKTKIAWLISMILLLAGTSWAEQKNLAKKTQRKVDTIIVHHSASRDVSAKEIDRWHRKNTFTDKYGIVRHWRSIGYHYVIRKDGTIEPGRPLNMIGAHAKGRNAHSIGICLTGYDEFTDSQVSSLKCIIKNLARIYADLKIERHRSWCPGRGLDLEKIRP